MSNEMLRQSSTISETNLSASQVRLTPRPPSVASKLMSPRPGTSDSYASSQNSSLLGGSLQSTRHRPSDVSQLSESYHPFFIDQSPDSGISSASASSDKRPTTKRRSTSRSRRSSGSRPKTISRSKVPEMSQAFLNQSSEEHTPLPTTPVSPDAPKSPKKTKPDIQVVEHNFVPAPPTTQRSKSSGRPRTKQYRPRKQSKSISKDRRFSTMPEGPTLTDLSDSFILDICGYLGLKDKLSLELSCRRLQRVVRTIWDKETNIVLSEIMQEATDTDGRVTDWDSLISSIISRAGPFLHSIDLSLSDLDTENCPIGADTFKSIGSYCSNIVKLDLSNLPIYNKDIKLLCEANLVALTDLIMVQSLDNEPSPDKAMGKWLKKIPTLKVLNIAKNGTITGQCLNQISGKLEVLNINNCVGLEDENFKMPLSQICHDLKILCADSARIDLGNFIRNLRRLEQLDLDCYENPLSEQVFIPLEELKHLKLCNTYALTQDVMDNIGTACTNIETLRIAGKETTIEKIKLVNCKNFKKLRLLDVCFWEHLADSDLSAVCAKQKNLEELHLHNCVKISGTELLKLIRHNLKLTNLHLTGCTKIDETFIKYASDVCKQQEQRTKPLTVRVDFHISDNVLNLYSHHKFVIDVLRSWKFMD